MKKDELFAELKAMAKRANQRLVRLEKKGIDSASYKIALNDINNRGRNNNRFIYNKSMSYSEMEKELAITKRFLNSESSTVSGIKRYTKQRLSTLSNNFVDEKGEAKFDLTSNPQLTNRLYNFFQSKEYKRLSEIIPSNILVEVFLEKGGKTKDIKRELIDEYAQDDEFISMVNKLRINNRQYIKEW